MWHDRTTWSGSLTDNPTPPGWPGWPGCWSTSAPATLWWRSLWITSAVHVRGDPLSWSCATRSQLRSDLPRDLPRSSSPWSPTGCWHGLRRSAVIGTPQLDRVRPCEQGDALVLEPPLSTRQVRRRAAAVLPGVQVRRLLFWRYPLRWRKPINPYRATIVGWDGIQTLVERISGCLEVVPALGSQGIAADRRGGE
jgi:hypothetical protein